MENQHGKRVIFLMCIVVVFLVLSILSEEASASIDKGFHCEIQVEVLNEPKLGDYALFCKEERVILFNLAKYAIVFGTKTKENSYSFSSCDVLTISEDIPWVGHSTIFCKDGRIGMYEKGKELIFTPPIPSIAQ